MGYFKEIGLIIALLSLIVLSACGGGSGDAFSGNLKKIEYDDLIEKLDNEESFFLLTLETTDEAFVNSGLEKVYDEVLQSHDIEAFYLGIQLMDEADEDVYEEHAEQYRTLKEYSRFGEGEGGEVWYPATNGLAYSDQGKVIPLDWINKSTSREMRIEWKDIQQLQGEYDSAYDEIIAKQIELNIRAYEEKESIY